MGRAEKNHDTGVILAIDPSVVATGWAVYAGQEVREAGTIRPKADRYTDRASEVVIDLVGKVLRFQATVVVLEEPEVWYTPKGDRAKSSGALMKLGFVVGAIWQRMLVLDCDVRLAPVRKWKGQLPKKAVEHRLLRLGWLKENHGLDDNAVDAVGLLAWHQGAL